MRKSELEKLNQQLVINEFALKEEDNLIKLTLRRLKILKASVRDRKYVIKALKKEIKRARSDYR